MRNLKTLIYSLLSILAIWGCAGSKLISSVNAPEVMAWGNLNGTRDSSFFAQMVEEAGRGLAAKLRLGKSSTAAAAWTYPQIFDEPSLEKVGEIIRLSDEINALVARDAQIEKLGEGFIWSEGPVWISEGGYLLFTDVPGNTLYKWTASEGVSVFLKPSGFAGDDDSFLREGGANGLALEKEGHLILCDSGNRAIVSLDLSTKAKTVLVDSYQGKRLNSPNDLVIHSNGDIYFTDPPYGLKDMNDSPHKELTCNGVYRFSRDGGITLLTDEFTFPNGVALAPDEKTLYVTQSDPEKPILMAYDLMDDGSIANGRILFNFSALAKQGKPGLPDGMAIDVNGNLFVTGPGGVHVITPDGVHLGTIATGQAVANCAFGDDGSVLYLTSNMMLCRVRLKTKGMYF